MGDDLSLPERESIRTPMQWSAEGNAGFSKAPREWLVRPVIDDEQYGYRKLNVADQRRDKDSLLNQIERMIRTRKVCPEFGWGTWEILKSGEPSIFAQRYEWQGGVVIAIHNLAGESCSVTLDLSDYDAGHLIDLLSDQEYQHFDGGEHTLKLEGYGYRWFRVDGLRHTER